MKKFNLILVLCLIAQVTFSQVVVLNYMKVPPGGGETYEKAEIHAQKVMQERVNRGEMIGWELYQVQNRGAESPYHYVTVDIYENLVASLKGISGESVQAALGDQADAAIDEIMSSRDLIYRETLGRMGGISLVEDDKYLLVTYMKAKDPQKYFDMERIAFQPLHQIAIDNGEMAGWSVWTPRLFDQAHTDYTALTVNGYSSLEQMGMTNYGKWYNAYTSGKSKEETKEMEKFFDATESIRTIVQSQVWRKVASTTPADE